MEGEDDNSYYSKIQCNNGYVTKYTNILLNL